jgi:repressor LexA
MHAQTRRQREVLDLISRYIDSHGYRPSYQVIARILGLRSRAGIARIVQDLESQGLIERVREDGHFSLAIKRNIGDSVTIDWLNVPEDSEANDNLDRPLSLPPLMLGSFDAAGMRAFRVPDNALAADHICEDDIAIIELREFTRDGQTVVAVLNDKQTVLRKYYRVGAEVELRTADGEGETLIVAANRVKIIGIYRGLIRAAS